MDPKIAMMREAHNTKINTCNVSVDKFLKQLLFQSTFDVKFIYFKKFFKKYKSICNCFKWLKSITNYFSRLFSYILNPKHINLFMLVYVRMYMKISESCLYFLFK